MARLQEDNKTLRERETRDHENIWGLLDEIEKKDRDLRDKYLEFECGKKRAQDEVIQLKNKYCELEARVLKLVDDTLSKFKESSKPVK